MRSQRLARRVVRRGVSELRIAHRKHTRTLEMTRRHLEFQNNPRRVPERDPFDNAALNKVIQHIVVISDNLDGARKSSNQGVITPIMRYLTREMRNNAPLLLPLFRSSGLARVLAYLHARPRDAHDSISDLARRLTLDVDAARRYVEQLEQAGIVRTWMSGRSRIVSLDPASPLQPELGALVLKAFGPPPLLASLLDSQAGVDKAYIFGSWAERYLEKGGPPPSDIDVLVVGSPVARDLRRSLAGAATSFGREVNLTVLTPEEWASPTTAFARTVKSGALVPLVP